MSELIGKKVVDIRPMTEKEMIQEYWDTQSTVIVFDDGTYIYASSDEEGNGPGVIFGTRPKGEQFAIY